MKLTLRLQQSMFIGLMTSLLTSTGWAQVSTGSQAAPNVGQSLFQVFGALIFIITLIFFAAWVASRFKLIHGASGQRILTLAATPLGRKEKLVLAQACGKTLLLGVTTSTINVLHVYEENCRRNWRLSRSRCDHWFHRNSGQTSWF